MGNVVVCGAGAAGLGFSAEPLGQKPKGEAGSAGEDRLHLRQLGLDPG